MTTSTLGFIGLGNMGHPMAKNLEKAGYSLFVYNRTEEKAEDFREKSTVCGFISFEFDTCGSCSAGKRYRIGLKRVSRIIQIRYSVLQLGVNQNFHEFIVAVPDHCVKFQGIFTTIC